MGLLSHLQERRSKGSESPHPVLDHLCRYGVDALGQCRPGAPRCPCRLMGASTDGGASLAVGTSVHPS